jgi:LacI family transcriptional regulator
VSKRVTITDVAAASGVSRATVSLVLRDEPRISADTRERVREAMKSLGYVYDRRAAIMRTQRSMTIGLVVTNVLNPYFAELAMALEVELDDSGFALLQGYSHDEHEREDRLLQVMVEHRVDGVVLLPSKDTTADHLQQRLVVAGMPHVLIARRVPSYEGDYVGIDNVRGGKLLGEHFGAEGYDRVAFLGGPRGSTARSDRQRGLKAGLKRYGVGLPPELNIPSESVRAHGIIAVESLLSRGPVPAAIACYSDEVAFGVVSGLRAAGLEPGSEVAVGSFDDVAEASIQHPALTSVATYPERVGAEASRLLIERIASPELASRQVVLTPRLSVRDSSILRGRRRAA